MKSPKPSKNRAEWAELFYGLHPTELKEHVVPAMGDAGVELNAVAKVLAKAARAAGKDDQETETEEKPEPRPGEYPSRKEQLAAAFPGQL